MSKLLITAATELEISELLQYLNNNYQQLQTYLYQKNNLVVYVLITGVAAINTTYQLTCFFAENKNIDIAINVGIAGIADKSATLATVYKITKDVFADMGATSPKGEFIDVFDMDFINPNQYPYTNKYLHSANPNNLFQFLVDTNAVTQNKISSTTAELDYFYKKYPFHLESMEGAAFFYVCSMCKIPAFLQVRAVSNYIEPRDKSRWQIKLAIHNLNKTIIQFLENDFN